MDINNLCMGCMNDNNDQVAVCPRCGWVEGTEPDSPLFLPPRTILEGKYLIGRVLGQGGFGITYLAWDANLNIKLAIKEFFPQDLASRAAGHSQVSAYTGSLGSQYEYGLDKFLKEAQTLAQFEGHPNIVSVRDFFKANGTAYFVMSYVEGITLKDHLANSGGRLPIDQARGIIMPVLDALKEVHKVNVLHRDISPDNIFINHKGQVVLIDFGAARQAIGEKGRSLSIILKPGYAPEEQYRTKGEQGAWTDIYAVGATLYHLVTGQQPPEALERLVNDTMQAPSELGAALSENEELALTKALAVRAGDRFQAVEEFQAALIGDPASYTVTAPAPSTHAPSAGKRVPVAGKKRSGGLLIGLAAVIIVGVAVYALWANGILNEWLTAFNKQPSEDAEVLVAEPEPEPEPEPKVIPVVNSVGNTVGNLVNGGLAAIQGDWIYFRSNQGGSLYKGNLASGGGASMVGTDSVWFINVSGDWIYYSNRDDNNRIYKIKTDGSERTAITDSSAWFTTLVGDWIYYVDGDDNYRLYKINVNGSSRTKLGDDSAWYINVVEDLIYYINRSDGSKIYRIKTDGTERIQLTDYASDSINVHGDWIYHANEENSLKLSRIHIDGGDTAEITDHPAWFVNVYNGWIYYVSEDDDFTVYKIKPDGSGRTKLTNEPSRYVVVGGDWVFYLDQAEEDSIYKVRLDGTDNSYIESGF